MNQIQIHSVAKVFDRPGVLERVMTLVTKVAAMGLLPKSRRIEALDEDSFRVVLNSLQSGNLIRRTGTRTFSHNHGAGNRRFHSTPVETADRLHWLAMVVADLAGSYNEFGIRRWFHRHRAQLDGKSPFEILGKNWSSDTEAAKRVRELARSLSAGGAT